MRPFSHSIDLCSHILWVWVLYYRLSLSVDRLTLLYVVTCVRSICAMSFQPAKMVAF